MVCNACGYVLTPFDKKCPRCIEGNAATPSRESRSVAKSEEQTEEEVPVGITWVKNFYWSITALASFAAMFCLTSILFTLVVGGFTQSTGTKVISEANTGFDALWFVLLNAIHVGWFFGLIGGITSAIPAIRHLRIPR